MPETHIEAANFYEYLPGSRLGGRRRSARFGSGCLRLLLWGLIVVALLLVAMVTVLLLWLQLSILGRTERVIDAFPEESTRPQAQLDNTSVNFLVLGSDSRISVGDPSRWEAGAQRTDTLMLVQFSPQHNTLTVMSIPRDSWVEVPGYGPGKINAAFSRGGVKLTIRTVEQLTGVRVDHFALLDFTAFKELTDHLGGVDIPTQHGSLHFDGEGALQFVRERYGLAGGDFDRVKRQQAWLRAVITKTLSSDTLSDPGAVYAIVTTVAEHSAMDEAVTLTTILDYAAKARHLRAQNLTFITAPCLGTGTSADGQSIVNLDQVALSSLMKAWREDEAYTYLKEHREEIPQLPQVVN